MKILLITLISLFFCTSAFSQNSDSLQYCVIIQNDSGVYVPNVKVRIVSFKREDNFLKNSAADFKGTACFTLAHGRDYNLIVDNPGYARIKKKISPKPEDNFLSDTVFLSSRITTTDVINVEANKDFMHMEDDKMVYDISKMKIDPGPNGLELMKRIPMVTVEGEDVKLRGSNAKILFDGREQNMYGDLRSIPTEMIEKVEVMTVVPAKYEAEGVDGVINVILKKIEDAKYKVSLSGWANSNKYGSFNQSANYKKNKFSLFLNSSERYYSPETYYYITRKDLSSNQLVYTSNDTSSNTTKGYRINPGIIYDISKNLYFGVEGVFNFSRADAERNTYRKYSYLTNTQKLIGRNNNDNNDYSFVSYINKQEIFGSDELNLEFNLNNTKYYSDFYQLQELNNISTPFTNGYSDIRNNNYNVKFDYSKKISDELKFETGLKDSYKKENNNYSNTDTSGVFSSDYEFRENIYSYYGTLSYNARSLRIKPGIRIEYSDMKGIVNYSSEFTNYQFDVFPSFLITKFLNTTSQLQFSYGKRVERPRFTALNPFPIKRDIYFLTEGNPELKPAYLHNFEFKFNMPFNKNSLNANVFLKHGSNLIQNFRYIDSIYTRSKYINDGYSNEYGFDGGLNLNFGEYWFTNFYGRYGKKIYSNDSLNLGSDRVSYNLNLSANYSNPELFDVSVFSSYTKYNYSALTNSEPYLYTSMSIGKNFFDRKLILYLNLDDVFNSFNSESTYTRNGYEEYTSFTGAMGRNVSLNIRFTFGNYDEKRQKGKDIKGEDYGD